MSSESSRPATIGPTRGKPVLTEIDFSQMPFCAHVPRKWTRMMEGGEVPSPEAYVAERAAGSAAAWSAAAGRRLPVVEAS